MVCDEIIENRALLSVSRTTSDIVLLSPSTPLVVTFPVVGGKVLQRLTGPVRSHLHPPSIRV